MKKWLSMLMVLVLLPFAALAQGTGTASGNGEPVVVAIATPLNGYLYSDMWGDNNVDANLRSLLHGYHTVAWQPTGEFTVDKTVVTSYAATDDGRGNRTYTFQLAQNLAYNDGSPITARDYVFTVLLQSDPAITALDGQNTHFNDLLGSADYRTAGSGVLSGVRLLGDYSFSLTVLASELPFYFEPVLMDVFPTPLQVIAPGFTVRDDGRGAYLSDGTAAGAGAASPLTAELLRGTLTGDRGYSHQPYVTSGPYQLSQYDVANNSITLTANPRYLGNWEGRKPELKTIRVIHMDNEEALQAYARGEVQIVHKMTDTKAIDQARALQTEGKGDVTNFLSAGYIFLAFACEQTPTDDANVRLALAMCIDRNAFCTDLFGGNALPVYAYYGYGQWMVADHTDALAAYEIGFDVDSARALLEKARYIYNEDGEKFEDGKGQVRCRIQKGKLIPLDLRWAKTEGKAADYMEMQLTRACDLLGIRLSVTEMAFSDMLRQYWRTDGERSYNLFFMTETFAFAFDPYQTYNTGDAWQGSVNVSGLRDERLMNAARAMRRVKNGDTETFIAKWLGFQDRWRAVMPTAPVCTNVYFDISQPWLYAFGDNIRYGLARALVYTTLTPPADAPSDGTDATPVTETDAAAGS